MTIDRKRIVPLIAAATIAGGALAAAGAAGASEEHGRRGHMEHSERGEMDHHGMRYADRDHDRARMHMDERGPRGANALSYDALAGKLAEQGYGDITKIEHKGRGVVEVKAKDKTGALVELSVDGRTGAVLRSKSE